MTTLAMTPVSVTPLAPFGAVLHGDGTTDARTLDADMLAALATEHRVLVLRGFAPLPGDAFVEL